MKIVAEISSIIYRGTGVGEYIYHLLSNLLKLDKENEYTFFYIGKKKALEQASDVLAAGVKQKIINLPSALEKLKDKIRFLAGGILAPGGDIYFNPDFFLPLFLRARRKVITVHDLCSILFPHFFVQKTSLFAEKIKYSVSSADVIIAVSEQTKNDLVKFLNVPPEKVEVVYNGCGGAFSVKKDPALFEALSRKYKLDSGFLLSVGTLQPRKNYVNLLEAFKKFIERRSEKLYLVIAGSRGWLYEDIFKKCRDLSLEGRVIFTGYVSDSELAELYRRCEVFVFPSFYEGFGIPLLEAMNCGAPVVCSNRSSFPEVAGDAAVYFNPEDAEEISLKIEEVFSDIALRDELVAKGFEKSKLFSWEKSAKQLLQIFKGKSK